MQRKTKWKRDRAAQEVYQQLSEAMDCLQHIFTEGCGCAYVGPTAGGDHASRRSKGPPCTRFATCEGLRRLMRHFAPCAKKLAPGGCLHCKRMWQLLRLHAAVCDRSDQSCKVPLCKYACLPIFTLHHLLITIIIRLRTWASISQLINPITTCFI